jgi:hypothetical protein
MTLGFSWRQFVDLVHDQRIETWLNSEALKRTRGMGSCPIAPGRRSMWGV